MSAQLILDRIFKEYPTDAGSLSVLKDISFEATAGETIALVGPSGSGKSTLLNIIATLLKPTDGRMTLGGIDPSQLDEPALARFRRQKIGLVFQEHHMLPSLSAFENILLPTIAENSPTKEQFDRAKKLLDRVGLTDRADHLPGMLSGGEKQRIALARALTCRPTVVLADEPTGNLDHTTAELVTELLMEMPGEEDAILITATHSEPLAKKMGRTIELFR
jgi:lipoprotein-releasing system ATP-binding protein